jgi:phytoene desaturase
VLRTGGYSFDTGPTILTMPDLVADAFDCVGERTADWLDLAPVDPAYRAHFADGSVLDVRADVEAMAAGIAELCGPAEAAGYRRLVAWMRRLYRAQLRTFIDRNVDSPLGLLTPDLARLVAAGGFGRLAPAVARHLSDPRTQRVFSFQSMYAGLSPYDALALYAVIAYMDTVGGVYFPRGGMHALPVALAGAAAKHGVEFSYSEAAVRIERNGQRASAVHTSAGRRIPCDAVVVNADLPGAWDLLDPAATVPPRRRRLRYSPSCALLLAGSAAAYPGAAHHAIHFGAAWGQTFDEVVSGGRLMSDPSFLVTTPTVSDPELAPPGRHAYAVLFPVPNLAASSPLDWGQVGPRYAEEMLATVQARGYPGFGSDLEVEHFTTPAGWAAQGLAAGTPFSAAHTFGQTGPFRPANLARGWENVVFAGCGTVPGIGVPTVLISGRLAAERVTGPDRAYRSRAWPC